MQHLENDFGRAFQTWNSSKKNAITNHSEYSLFRIVPENAPLFPHLWCLYVYSDVDDVHEMMDDIQEQTEVADEISRAISEPAGFGMDIDEVSKMFVQFHW